MKRKSKDIRKAAIDAVITKKLTHEEAANIFGVSIPTIYSWIKIYKQYNTYEGRHPSGRKPVFTDEQKNRLKDIIEEKNDITLKEIVERMGNIVKKSTISRYLIMMGYSYKKKL